MEAEQVTSTVDSDRQDARAAADRIYWVLFTLFTAFCVVWLLLASATLEWSILPQAYDMHMAAADPNQHAVDLGLSFATLLLGLSMIWLVPDSRTARWFSVGLIGTSVGFSLTAHHLLGALSPGMELNTEPTPLSGAHLSFHLITGGAYTGGLLLFPDGRWPRISAPTAAAGAVLIAALTSFVYLGHQPVWFVWYCGLAMIVAGFGFQLYKARYSPTAADRRLSSTFAVLFLFALMVAATAVVIEWLTPLGHWLGLAHLGDEDPDLTVAITVLSPFLAATTGVVWGGIIWYPKLAQRSVRFHNRRYILGVLTGLLLACYVLIEFGAHTLIEEAELSEGWVTASLILVGAIGLVTERGRERIAAGFRRLLFGTEEEPGQRFRELMGVAPVLTVPAVVSALATVLAETLSVSTGRLIVLLPEGTALTYAWPDESTHPTDGVTLGVAGASGILQVGPDDTGRLDSAERRLLASLGTEAADVVRRLSGQSADAPHVVVVPDARTSTDPDPAGSTTPGADQGETAT